MKPQMTTIQVISSHSAPSTNAPLNHRLYCKKWGYTYLFDATPYENKSPFDQKTQAILANLQRAEWLVWVDDDVYFMDQSRQLVDFIPNDDQIDLIICDSPVNNDGHWTFINSGVMLIRNSDFTQRFFAAVLQTNLTEVVEWWDTSQYGMFTNTDQDCIAYQIETMGGAKERVQIIPYLALNARVCDFSSSPTECFIWHLAGIKNKMLAVRALRRRFRLSECLTDACAFRESSKMYSHSMFFHERKRPSRIQRVKPLVRRMLKPIFPS